MSVLDEVCKECGAKLRDHIIGGPAPYHPNPVIETDLERRIRRLRAAVNGDDFAFEIDGGSPFDDAKALLDAYDRLRRLAAWCRPRLKREAYQEYVDKCLAGLPLPEPDPVTMTNGD